MGWDGGETGQGHGQLRRPENRAPSGPSASRTYSLARAATAEAAPSASWAFFCAGSDEDDDDDVEANRRRGVLAWRRARNVADCITLFRTFSFVNRDICRKSEG